MGKSPKIHKVVPVFVGGTGRSGTTVMGDLLGKHPDVRTSTPIEIKFLANRSGLLDVVFGRDEDVARTKTNVTVLNFRTYRKRKKKRVSVQKEFGWSLSIKFGKSGGILMRPRRTEEV